MHPEVALKKAVQSALQALYTIKVDDILLQHTRKEFEGNYTLVTFPYTRYSKGSPEATATAIGEWLTANEPSLVLRFNVVKGFLNLLMPAQVWLNHLAALQNTADPTQLPANGQKVMVEYSSPNTNKPLHLGHLRNNFLGFSVSQILKAAGFDVCMANLINDRGIHICKSMLAYQKHGNGETPESSGMKGDHLIGKYYVVFEQELKTQAKALVEQGVEEDKARDQTALMAEARAILQAWEKNDSATVALWKQMNEWVYAGFDASYKRMGVSFDTYYYESNTYLLGKDIIEEGLEKGVFFQKEDKSVWIDLTAEKLDEKLVLRGDGTSVYITQDLGTADLKYSDYPFNKSVYVVGNEQDYHFAVLFKTLAKLGRPYAGGMYHLSYGMVDLPSGKMKSREGTVVDADELMASTVQLARERTLELGKISEFDEAEQQQLVEMLGIGAIKYYLLKVEPKKRMLFNPAESIDMQGNTATSIQYTHARICSILRKAEELGILATVPAGYKPKPVELDLLFQLAQVQQKVQAAAEEYSPSTIANYVYDLSRTYNSFFAELSIFKADNEEDKEFRVLLSGECAKVISKCMGLLGIQVPTRM